MNEITIAELGWILGLVGIAFGIWGQVRNSKQVGDQAAREMGTIVTKLETLSRQMDGMQAQLQSFNACILDISTRLGAVEAKADRAHVRLDRMEAEELRVGS